MVLLNLLHWFGSDTKENDLYPSLVYLIEVKSPHTEIRGIRYPRRVFILWCVILNINLDKQIFIVNNKRHGY